MKNVDANKIQSEIEAYCSFGIDNMKTIETLADLRDEYNYRYGILEGIERVLKFIDVDDKYLLYEKISSLKNELTKEMRNQIKRLI